MMLIWVELFAHTTPALLSKLLLAWTAISLIGVWLIGRDAWFRYCDFFAVFMRQVARIGVFDYRPATRGENVRSEEHTSELQSLMRISYAVFCLKKKKKDNTTNTNQTSSIDMIKSF